VHFRNVVHVWQVGGQGLQVIVKEFLKYEDGHEEEQVEVGVR